MGLLKELGGDAQFLKAGFLGFNKSGKTYTSVLLACGVRAAMKSKLPIGFFDTEGGSGYVEQTIVKLTGKKAVGLKSRSFDDLLTVTRECETNGASVLIVDSITHVWRELCSAYMKRLNELLASKGKQPKNRMDIQDIMKVKDQWSVWPDLYLNSKLHIIICGRAGFEWNMVEDDDGKKQLTKTGVKMKVESEFGFEPSLLVEMERVQDIEGGERMVHRATVLGDRFNVIDAQTCDNPTFDFFKPHVAMLGGVHVPIDTEVKSQPDVDVDGNAEWQREKRERAILCEEIQGELTRAYPGMTADAKTAKADLVFGAFKTRSWTKVETLDAQTLRSGLETIKAEIGRKAVAA